MIQKIITVGIAVAVFSVATPAFAAEARTASTRGTVSATSVSCLKTAVAKRESALQAGLKIFHGDILQAYTTRASELATAYTGTDLRTIKTNVKAAWKTFRGAVNTSRADWKYARKTAWDTFKAEAKSCGQNAIADSQNANADVD